MTRARETLSLARFEGPHRPQDVLLGQRGGYPVAGQKSKLDIPDEWPKRMILTHIIDLYSLIVFVAVILSWVQLPYDSPVVQFVNSLTGSKRQVRSDDHGILLVTVREDLKQQLGPFGREWDIADLVDDEQLEAGLRWSRKIG